MTRKEFNKIMARGVFAKTLVALAKQQGANLDGLGTRFAGAIQQAYHQLGIDPNTDKDQFTNDQKDAFIDDLLEFFETERMVLLNQDGNDSIGYTDFGQLMLHAFTMKKTEKEFGRMENTLCVLFFADSMGEDIMDPQFTKQ